MKDNLNEPKQVQKVNNDDLPQKEIKSDLRRKYEGYCDNPKD